MNKVVFDFPPPAPVTTNGNVPAGVDAVVMTVNIDEQAGPQDALEKVALAPLGKPETEKATGCVLPDNRVAPIWFCAEAPFCVDLLPLLESE